MKLYRLLLAYYTFIVTIALFVWAVFYGPRPQGLFLALLLIPASIYFMLLIGGISKPQASNSSNDNHGKNVKLPLIILMTLFIGAFSIFAYSAITSRSLNSELISASISKQIDLLKSDLSSQNKIFQSEIVKELEGLKSQLVNLKTSQKANEDTTTIETVTPTVGSITIIDKKYPTVNVYASKSTSSAVVGKAEFGKNYTFIEKVQDWYLILLGAKEGFISSQFVKEVQY